MAKIVSLTLLILAGIIVLPLILSGVKPDGSMLINNSGDNLWHLSLATETTRQIPPTFPGMNGVKLSNYHYFSDLGWGMISKYSGIDIFTVYFYLGSAITCLTLVWVVYRFALRMTGAKYWAIVPVLTTLFLGSASFIKPILVPGSVWSGNNFMLDQPYDQVANLHTAIGYILILLGGYFMYLWEKNELVKYGFIAGTIFSLLVGYKSFFAVPILLSFGIYCLTQIKKTYGKSIFPLILAFSISAIIYISVSSRLGGNDSPVLYRPFWLISKMMEDADRFNLPNFILREQVYQSAHNNLRLVQLTIEKVIFFILGNFWIKVAGVLFLIRRYISSKEHSFFLISIFISILLCLFFVPTPDPFNAVQFGQVAVIYSGLFLGIWLIERSHQKYLLVVVPLLLISFVPDFFNQRKFNEYHIPKDEVAALTFIKSETPATSVFMVDPVFRNEKMKVSGIGERRTYYTGGMIPWLLGIDDNARKVTQKSFFSATTTNTERMAIANLERIDYIYSSTTNLVSFENFKKIFSNQSVTIYQVR